jgi:DNA-binding transcriptional LysR family regulator
MPTLPGLDIDLLRTLALIAEEGSFTRAAERVGRTQSAVSLQMQRLEAVVGHSLLLRGKGGGVELTAQGQYLVERSRELLALNDEILGSLRAPQIHGTVRLGSPDDYSQRYLPRILARFADTHPAVAVEVLCGISCQLVPQLKTGNMDLMFCESGHEPRQWPAVELWRGPLKWITSDQYALHLEDPLPLSLSPGNCPWRPAWLDECIWRGAALRALERAGRRYSIVSTSATASAQQAAVIAGRAVTVSTIIELAPGLRPVRTDEGLPDLPDSSILLLKAREARQPMTDALAACIAEAFHDGIRPLGG